MLLWFQGNASQNVIELEPNPEFISTYQHRIDYIFKHLNPDVPELAEAHSSWNNGNLTSACATLLHYYRNREFDSTLWLQTTPPDRFVEEANLALMDTFQLQGVQWQQPRFESGLMNWQARGPRNDKEWAWLLNRHSYFVSLIHAYRQNGDNRYIEKLDQDLYDWLQQHPFPNRLTFSTSWRALETARRMLNSWNLVFFALQNEQAFRPETRLLMLASIHEHGVNLRNHASFWGGNHLLTEKTALALLATGWPEWRESANWLEYAKEAVRTELLDQTYPDGAYKELSNHYQRVVLRNAQYFLQIIQLSPDYTLDPLLEDRIKSMWNYWAYVMRPDGYGPLNNASDLEWNRGMLGEVIQQYNRPDWSYLATGGREGTVPPYPPSQYFEWAGHFISRDSWQDNRHWSFFDMGPHGSAHQHRDALHLSVYLGGRMLLTDSGRYTYAPGEWSEYFKGPNAHNIVLLDGEGPRPHRLTTTQPMQNFVSISEDADTYGGSVTFPGSWRRGAAYHRRMVHYQRGEFWLVVDQVLATGHRSVEAVWNFAPGITPTDADSAVLPLAVSNSTWRWQVADLIGSEDPVAGWYSPSYNVREPILQRRYQAQLKGPTLFIWLIAEDAQKRSTELKVNHITSSSVEIIWRSDSPEQSPRTIKVEFP